MIAFDISVGEHREVVVLKELANFVGHGQSLSLKEISKTLTLIFAMTTTNALSMLDKNDLSRHILVNVENADLAVAQCEAFVLEELGHFVGHGQSLSLREISKILILNFALTIANPLYMLNTK